MLCSLLFSLALFSHFRVIAMVLKKSLSINVYMLIIVRLFTLTKTMAFFATVPAHTY
jgi:hypothetical protein